MWAKKVNFFPSQPLIRLWKLDNATFQSNRSPNKRPFCKQLARLWSASYNNTKRKNDKQGLEGRKNTLARKYGQKTGEILPVCNNNEKIHSLPFVDEHVDRHWRIIYSRSCFLQHPHPSPLHSSPYPFTSLLPFTRGALRPDDGNCLLLVFVFHCSTLFNFPFFDV